jgi:hypothetical protein
MDVKTKPPFLFTLLLVLCVTGTAILMIKDAIKEPPIIRELSVKRVIDIDGPAIAYRYSVAGDESVVILRDEADLEVYRVYLARFGRFKP